MILEGVYTPDTGIDCIIQIAGHETTQDSRHCAYSSTTRLDHICYGTMMML